MSGTSMAAPHVTGAVALMFEKIVKPVRIHDIRNILLGSTDPVQVSPAEQLRVGSGRVNLNKILYNVDRYNRIQKSRVMSSSSAMMY
jgi:subtilisin family serine protease